MGTDFTRWVHQPAPSQYVPVPTQEPACPEPADAPERTFAECSPPTARESNAAPSAEGNTCRRIAADFQTTPDGRVCIFFPFSGMSGNIARIFFESGFFEIREAFSLPEHVMAQLPTEASPVIAVGNYAIVRSKTGFMVVF